MTSLSTIAKDVATSDAGKAFGWKKIPKDANLREKIEILGENALKVSHYIPVVGTLTGLLSLGLVISNVSNKKKLDEEDTSKITRSILAIVNLPFVLMFIDFVATHLRKNEMPLNDLVNQLNQLDEKNRERAPKTKQMEPMKDTGPSSLETRQIGSKEDESPSLPKTAIASAEDLTLEEMVDQRRENSRIEERALPYDDMENPWRTTPLKETYEW